MNARIGWTLTAIGLVITFIGARFYIGDRITEQVTAPVERPQEPIRKKKPRKVVKRDRAADPLDRLKDVSGRVMALAESTGEGRDDVRIDAHSALEDAEAFDTEWTPELEAKATKQMSQLQEWVDAMDPPEPDISSHLLAARVAISEAAGNPDEEARAKLEALREAAGGELSWE